MEQVAVVLGSGGMLGRAVVDALIPYYYTLGLLHADCDILNPRDLEHVRERYNPKYVVNCAGAPNQDSEVNSLGPWYIARIFRCQVIHISTDCVWSDHSRSILPEPNSNYGRSKLLGEQLAPHVCNIRTSFIGYQHGLLKWLLDQKAGSVIQGWTNALWSGSTVYEVAEALTLAMARNTIRSGVMNLATLESASKYDILVILAKAFRLPVTVEPVDTPYIDRSLKADIPLRPVYSTSVLNRLLRGAPVGLRA